VTSAVNAINRIVLSALGLLLLVGGVLGLALGFEAFGRSAAHGPLLTPRISDYPSQHEWFWWAVGAACAVIGVLALWWLLAQARTEGIRRLDLTRDGDDGLTVVHAGALTEAVETDITTTRGVTGASAHLRGNRGRRLDIVVDLDDRADIRQLREKLTNRSIPRAREVVDDPELPVTVELRPTPGRQRRVR
jgi:hypothetical protein